MIQHSTYQEMTGESIFHIYLFKSEKQYKRNALASMSFMDFQALTSQSVISFIPFPLINKTKFIFLILLQEDRRMEFSLQLLHSPFSPFPSYTPLSPHHCPPIVLPSNSPLILLSPSPSPSSLFFSFILLCLHPHPPLSSFSLT